MTPAIGSPELVARRLADALGDTSDARADLEAPGGSSVAGAQIASPDDAGEPAAAAGPAAASSDDDAGEPAAASSDDDAGEPAAANPYVGTDAGGTVCVDVPVERWHDALQAAQNRFALDFFDWLSAVDQMDADPPGMDVVAHLVCSTSGGEGIGASAGLVRMMLRTRVPASDLRIASVTDLWPGAAWHERETHEMFGVRFDDFDDGTGRGLRPLLLPDGFEGTPLRKSFVLAARASKAWPGAKEPGESDAHAAPARRKMLPPGVPDPTWGPRDA